MVSSTFQFGEREIQGGEVLKLRQGFMQFLIKATKDADLTLENRLGP